MKLYDYFRSSAAYRVRIALNLKGVEYQQVPVSLVKGEQSAAPYLGINPQGLVPALELDDGTLLSQSLAICEYLDEAHPTPALLPAGALSRARVRALAQAIACDIHPLNNLRVLNYLTDTLQVDKEARLAWYRHWIEQGLRGFEALLRDSPDTGEFCHGNDPTLADVCLVPQVFNARRFECDLASYPTVVRIGEACEAIPAFAAAAPARQPDAA